MLLEQWRIIPTDQQNLGQVLKENGLKEYDEYSLLMLSMGRCAQDDYYLAPIEDGELPKEIKNCFFYVQMQTGGYGVAWDNNMTISDAELYRIGQDVPLSAGDFKNFVVHRVVTASEAAEIR